MSIKVLLPVSSAVIKIDGTDRYRRGATITLNPNTKTLTFVGADSVTRINAVIYSQLGTAANKPFGSYADMVSFVNKEMVFKGITLENVNGKVMKINGRPQAKDLLNVLWDKEPGVGENCITIKKDGGFVLDNVSFGRIFLDDSMTACASYAALVTWMLTNGYWKGEYAQAATVTVSKVDIASNGVNTAFGSVACYAMDLTNATELDGEDLTMMDSLAATIFYKRTGSTVNIPVPMGTTRRIEGITNANQITIFKPDTGSITAVAEIYGY